MTRRKRAAFSSALFRLCDRDKNQTSQWLCNYLTELLQRLNLMISLRCFRNYDVDHRSHSIGCRMKNTGPAAHQLSELSQLAW